ncbi:O-acyltransferase WSD1 [Heracleum sosnowskyi]|uniref:O-acyltransferase WSD1 n=1 Tax=Heracleum sosnowskyi TaxID=360622 RepID=A0AAD8M4D4_9APIA|nr:O-acyltransferase WSD1 [Heracleum sosnowskyi]
MTFDCNKTRAAHDHPDHSQPFLMETKEKDEPVTPAGRLFLRQEMNTIIHCAIAGKHPLNIPAIKSAVETSIIMQHPRFTSLLVTDRHGHERWRRTQVNLDNHIIIRHEHVIEVNDHEKAVNEYIADLSVSSPLDTSKPLWEMHILMAHDCVVFRIHHALGDGVSLMSMLLSCCRKSDDPEMLPEIKNVGPVRRDTNFWKLVVKAMWVIFFTVVYVLELMLRSLWVKDKRTALSGGAGVELWPRCLVTAKFRLDDMKIVKNVVAKATINDVLFGVISCGLSKYLDIQSPEALKEGTRLTGLAMINMRSQKGLQDVSDFKLNNKGTRWGNKFGTLLLPVYYHRNDSDPLQYLKRAKVMIDRKKLSLEGYFSYKVGYFLMSYLGSTLAGWLNYRICSNTTFTISNVIGPGEEVTIAGNPVEYIRVNTSSLPHAITMHMLSYAGRADLQILVLQSLARKGSPEIEHHNLFEDDKNRSLY